MALSLEEEFDLFTKYNNKFKKCSDKEIIEQTRNYLKQIENIKNMKDKMEITRELLSFLYINKDFVEYNSTFKQTIRTKMEEFYTDYNWEAISQIYYFYFFGETIDKTESKFKKNIINDVDNRFENLYEQIKKL